MKAIFTITYRIMFVVIFTASILIQSPNTANAAANCIHGNHVHSTGSYTTYQGQVVQIYEDFRYQSHYYNPNFGHQHNIDKWKLLVNNYGQVVDSQYVNSYSIGCAN